MFTGLIEQVGRVARREARGGGARLTIAHAAWDRPLAAGDSVAVDGACLTVAEVGDLRFAADVLEETLRLTTLGRKAIGAAVNLERAMPADGRFGGHLVTGHVDGVGTVRQLANAGHDWVLAVRCERDVAAGIVLKGSIAVDGISLTVTRVLDDGFEVHVIPFTLAHTGLQQAGVGTPVNLETDVIGKYVQRYLQGRGGAAEAGGDGAALAVFL
jgi:riboflavin synthase